MPFPLRFRKFHYPLLSLLAVLSLSSVCEAETQTIPTSLGSVIGRVQHGVNVFKGIPYAEPPEGALRWHAPVVHKPWTSSMNAFKEGPACLQSKGVGQPQVIGSEDCLHLNVWAPSENKTLKAVMVFIHGGFYVEGASDEKDFGDFHIQNGFELAKKGNVVVVSFDYRLGALGFLAAPALNDGSSESQSGNFGLMDQIAALKWVQENIASFGGDPSRVTIFGQSAGASSVLTLMASPMTEGLFSQAIVESGYLKAIPRSQAFALSDKLISQSGCAHSTALETATCLRALPGEKVISSVPSTACLGSNGLFVPNEDGFIVKEPLDQAYSLGHVRKIPVIMGTNSDETSTLATALYGPKIKTDDQFANLITQSYGAPIWDLAKPLYESTELGTPQAQLVQLSTDLIFTCPISTLLRSLAKEPSHDGHTQTWRYVFSHHLPLPVLSDLGAFHGLEIVYAFGNLPSLIALSPSEKEFSQAMLDYWTTFAKNGDPNATGQQPWPEFQSTNESVLEFGSAKNDIHVLNGFRTEQCSSLGL